MTLCKSSIAHETVSASLMKVCDDVIVLFVWKNLTEQVYIIMSETTEFNVPLTTNFTKLQYTNVWSTANKIKHTAFVNKL